jgi:DNA segregation ATPase FtsK/SpoIIIE, S-DNA-T family
MRRGRRRKKFTYDSSETRTVIGLVFVAVSVVTILSVFTQGIAFDFVKNLFGNTSLLYSAFFFLLGIKLLNKDVKKIPTRIVLGLFWISVATSALLATKNISIIEMRQKSFNGEFGGIVGFTIMEFLSDLLSLNAVAPLMIVLIFLSISQVLNLSLGEYLSKISLLLNFIITKLRFLPTKKQKTDEVSEIAKKAEKIPTMFGDFSPESANITKDDNIQVKKPKNEDNSNDLKFKGIGDGQSLQNDEKNTETKYKEVESKGGLLVQDELRFPKWEFPVVTLLDKPKKQALSKKDPSIEKNKNTIVQTLMSFQVKAEVVDALIGPSVTQYALNMALGTKVAKIANLRNDLALALATYSNSVRIEAPIPGTSYVGIEVPNKNRQTVTFAELVEDDAINYGKLPVTIGKNVSGDSVFADIQKMPHLLIAGSTGSGKSVVTNSFIMSLLMKKTPDEVRFILVDPKQVEFSDYNGIHHLLTPVITDMSKVNNALKWAIGEMERRYTEFKDERVRNIEGYNEKSGFSALPYIVIVIDEMADMLMGQNGAEIESSIVRLAQKARATGIHLILATQRPSVDVITGLIKANIPGRLALSVTTQVDSRVILDQVGAETLLGKGDLLYKDPSLNRLQRIQGTFVSQEEVLRVVNYIKDQGGDEVEYSAEITKTQADPNAPPEASESLKYSDDDLFIQAANIIVNSRKGSSSLLQRKLSVGYNRAAKLIDELEENGIVGPAKGSKPRDVLISDVASHLAKMHSDQTNVNETVEGVESDGIYQEQ